MRRYEEMAIEMLISCRFSVSPAAGSRDTYNQASSSTL